MVRYEREGPAAYLNWQISVDPIGRVSEALRSCFTSLHPPEHPGRMQEDADPQPTEGQKSHKESYAVHKGCRCERPYDAHGVGSVFAARRPSEDCLPSVRSHSDEECHVPLYDVYVTHSRLSPPQRLLFAFFSCRGELSVRTLQKSLT